MQVLAERERAAVRTLARVAEISIVIPAYNAQRYLAETLESVRAQTFANWDLIVVDDGSSDGTALIAEQFAARDRRISVKQQVNTGVAAARNWGLRFTAPSAWAVLFLDADDVLEPDALDILRARLEADPAAVGAHGQVRFISSQGDPIRHGEAEAWGRSRRALVDGHIVDWPAPLPTTLSVLVLLNRVRTPGCVLLRRKAIESVGGFDTDHDLQVAADYDLWLRLACRGHFAYVDDVVLSYRLHEHSLSRNVRATNTVSRTVRKKLARSTLISREQRELATWGYRYSSLLRSSHWFRWAQDSIRRRRLGAAANQARHALVELLRFYLDRA